MSRTNTAQNIFIGTVHRRPWFIKSIDGHHWYVGERAADTTLHICDALGPYIYRASYRTAAENNLAAHQYATGLCK